MGWTLMNSGRNILTNRRLVWWSKWGGDD